MIKCITLEAWVEFFQIQVGYFSSESRFLMEFGVSVSLWNAALRMRHRIYSIIPPGGFDLFQSCEGTLSEKAPYLMLTICDMVARWDSYGTMR